MKIMEQPICHYINGTYREQQDLFLDNSNFPHVGQDGLCPLLAGRYWLKNFQYLIKYLPPMVPEGYWRVTMLFMGKNESADLQVFLKISMESFW